MAKILKFVYATILILFLFVIATEVNGKTFSRNFLIYLLHNILSNFNDNALFLSYITAFRNPCKSDSDCTKLKLKCDRHTILTCFWRHCYCIF